MRNEVSGRAEHEGECTGCGADCAAGHRGVEEGGGGGGVGGDFGAEGEGVVRRDGGTVDVETCGGGRWVVACVWRRSRSGWCWWQG